MLILSEASTALPKDGTLPQISGNQLSQTTLQGGVSTTRDYLGSLEYVDGVLESIHHAEGRVVSTNGNNTSTGLCIGLSIIQIGLQLKTCGRVAI